MKPIVIAGPTGSGKSDLALRLALATGGEIVNYDSVQVYRGFDIGSAKPSQDQRSAVPHHLFDIIDATDPFTAADYGPLARETWRSIDARGRLAVFAGGTFFYLRAFLRGLPEMPGRDEPIRERIRAIARAPRGPGHLHRWLSRIDPQSGRRIAPADRHRVERALEVWIASGRPISSWDRNETGDCEIPAIRMALTLDRPNLNAILDARVAAMYRDGLVDETRALLGRFPANARPFGAIGYREAAAVVHGEMSDDDAMRQTRRRTRAYAKRQLTWLRSERNVHWIDATDRGRAFEAALRLIEDER